MVNIAIVDDHLLFRSGLVLLLKTFGNINVALEANNGKELLEKLQEVKIDLILMDIQMPEMNGYDTCKLLNKHYPDILIMIVSELNSSECMRKIVELGAHGFFSKKASSIYLKEAIKLILEQGYYFPIEHGYIFVNSLIKNVKLKNVTKNSSTTNLTKQELLVLKMACKELNSGEIADQLNINIRTVDSHRKKIMVKTGSKNFIGSILFAIRHQYLSIEELISENKKISINTD